MNVLPLLVCQKISDRLKVMSFEDPETIDRDAFKYLLCRFVISNRKHDVVARLQHWVPSERSWRKIDGVFSLMSHEDFNLDTLVLSGDYRIRIDLLAHMRDSVFLSEVNGEK